MKMNYALASGLFLATGLMAQTNITAPAVQTAPAAISAPAVTTNKPAAKPATTKKKATPAKAAKPAAKPVVKKSTFVEKTVVLLPGVATVDARNVNVRGRSTILSEPLARVTKGDAVTVLEVVENKWAKGDDMKQWARIAYPTNGHVWIFAAFVNADKTVKPAKLNLRGGPGENYSIVGRMAKGETVTEITTKGEWMEIQPTAGCSAFIAATFLKQDAAMLASSVPVKPVVPVEPPSTNQIAEASSVIPPTVETQISPELRAFASEAAGHTNMPAAESDEPLPPRIVMREGYVRNATSIQAPSYYSLAGMDTGRTINYLYTSSTNVNLNRYANMHVIVTGEESLDARWPNTPVLTLQRIQVVKE